MLLFLFSLTNLLLHKPVQSCYYLHEVWQYYFHINLNQESFSAALSLISFHHNLILFPYRAALMFQIGTLPLFSSCFIIYDCHMTVLCFSTHFLPLEFYFKEFSLFLFYAFSWITFVFVYLHQLRIKIAMKIPLLLLIFILISASFILFHFAPQIVFGLCSDDLKETLLTGSVSS